MASFSSGSSPSPSDVIRTTRSGPLLAPPTSSSAQRVSPIRTKSGCFTCRLRRKRCDETRLSNGSCQTCSRLRIECLGWGSKRPDWIRDKKQVEAFKRRMRRLDDPNRSSAYVNKDSSPTSGTNLSEFGSHNNTNTSNFLFDTSSTGHDSTLTSNFWGLTNTESDPPFTPHRYQPSMMAETLNYWNNTTLLQTQPRSSISTIIEDTMIQIPGQPFPLPDAEIPIVQRSNADGTAYSYVPFQDPTPYSGGSHSDSNNLAHLASVPSNEDFLRFVDITQADHSAGHPEWNSRYEQISYYFKHVSKMQYCFAGSLAQDVISEMVARDGQGVVANAICALASIHDMLIRRAAGQEFQDAVPKHFFTYAQHQIDVSKTQNGYYSATDATAALQFVSFALFVGGIKGWDKGLKIAGDWFESIGIITNPNPLRAMWELDTHAKFASRVYLWFDIFSAITLGQAPRFLAVYRQVLGGKMRFWRRGLNMETTMGCPDDVLLSIAETANLIAWKRESARTGSVNYVELNQRVNEIRQFLEEGAKTHAKEEACQRKLEDDRINLTRSLFPALSNGISFSNTMTPSFSSSTLQSSGSSAAGSRSMSPLYGSGQSMHELPLQPEHLDDLQIQSRAASIFRQAAHLYLQSTIQELDTTNSIATCATRVMEAAKNLPPSKVDKSLVFPYCIAGCLTNEPTERQFFKNRLSPHNGVGNCSKAVVLMETVWERKAASGGRVYVDWLTTMEEIGYQLLLV